MFYLYCFIFQLFKMVAKALKKKEKQLEMTFEGQKMRRGGAFFKEKDGEEFKLDLCVHDIPKGNDGGSSSNNSSKGRHSGRGGGSHGRGGRGSKPLGGKGRLTVTTHQTRGGRTVITHKFN